MINGIVDIKSYLAEHFFIFNIITFLPVDGFDKVGRLMTIKGVASSILVIVMITMLILVDNWIAKNEMLQ